MAEGVLGLSTALNGLFSYTCLFPDSCALTFSELFCLLLRVKVEMDRAGRDPSVLALAPEFFSGERERERAAATVADGVLLCEDVAALEVSVRSEALRERRSVVPMSVTEDERLCLDVCLLRGGVVGTSGAGDGAGDGAGGGAGGAGGAGAASGGAAFLAGNSYKLGTKEGVSN